MMNESFAFSDLCRRVANLIRIGKIAEVDGAKVKIAIEKVKTNWLPIISTAGDTGVWIPISVGEQVAVFSLYGEMSQAIVIRSIHYNAFAAPENKDDVSINLKANVTANSDGKLEAKFEKGFEFVSGDLSIKMSEDKIIISCGSTSVALSADGIQLNGNSGVSGIAFATANQSGGQSKSAGFRSRIGFG
jgi:phage baseplate assembly protein V